MPTWVSSSGGRSGAIATAYALPSERQRGLLLEFVDALEDEWEQFYSDHLRRNAARRRSELSEKQAARGPSPRASSREIS